MEYKRELLKMEEYRELHLNYTNPSPLLLQKHTGLSFPSFWKFLAFFQQPRLLHRYLRYFGVLRYFWIFLEYYNLSDDCFLKIRVLPVQCQDLELFFTPYLIISYPYLIKCGLLYINYIIKQRDIAYHGTTTLINMISDILLMHITNAQFIKNPIKRVN